MFFEIPIIEFVIEAMRNKQFRGGILIGRTVINDFFACEYLGF